MNNVQGIIIGLIIIYCIIAYIFNTIFFYKVARYDKTFNDDFGTAFLMWILSPISLPLTFFSAITFQEY